MIAQRVKASTMTISKTSLNTMRLLKAQAIKAGFDVSSYDDLIVVVGNLWDIAQSRGLLFMLAKKKK